jgi:hypothetical protein
MTAQEYRDYHGEWPDDGEDHDDYHKSGDDADKVDPAFYRGTVEFAYALVRSADTKLASVSRAKP